MSDTRGLVTRLVLTLVAATAVATLVVHHPTPAAAAAEPRYVASVTFIKAVNESGVDLGGSDEVYGGFRAVDPRNQQQIAAFRTQFIEGFDTGETKSLDPDRNCLPARQVLANLSGRASFYDARGGDRWLCASASPGSAGVTAPFTIIGRLWEQEHCSPWHPCAAWRGDDALNAWSANDQNLGTGQLAFSAEGLATDLPSVGQQRVYTMTHRGSGAHYKSTISIQRVA